MHTFVNQGQLIAKTNYWQSEHCRAGALFLSWNAGAARVLLPMLAEMSTAKTVIISRGHWADQNNREALELLFDDGSDAPFVVTLVAEQCDRLIPDTDQGGGFVVAVWTEQGKQLERPGKYRHVAALPCLARWAEN